MRIFENNTTGEVVATSAKFEVMPVSETYDKYGQEVDADELGGDYDVTAYNYFDGSNWQTIIIEDDCGYVEWDEITGQDAKPYLKAIKKRKEIGEGFGLTYYKHKDLTFVKSQFASSWEDYRFMDEIPAE